MVRVGLGLAPLVYLAYEHLPNGHSNARHQAMGQDELVKDDKLSIGLSLRNTVWARSGAVVAAAAAAAQAVQLLLQLTHAIS